MRIQQASYRKMKWQNGLGETAEIDRYPKEGPFLWRLSLATIQGDGPFSTYTGYDRWLCVLNGKGATLNDSKIETHSPFRFSGDEPTFCRLENGPVSDLGLIFDRNKIGARMSIVEGEIKLSGGVNYIYDFESGDTFKYEKPNEQDVPKSLLITIFYSSEK